MTCCVRREENASYADLWPEGFVDLADLLLVVEGKELPAHSQFLANTSAVIHKMLHDCPAYSKQQPLVIEEAFKGYKAADMQTFLQHVYVSKKVVKAEEAVQLLMAADQFECPGLRQRAVHFLEDPKEHFLKPTCEDGGILFWLQLAERFNTAGFAKRCVSFISQHWRELQHDSRMLQLSPSLFVQLMDQHQEVIQSRSVVKRDKEMIYWCNNACNGHKVRREVTSYPVPKPDADIVMTFMAGKQPWCKAKKLKTQRQVEIPEGREEFLAKIKEKLTECVVENAL